MKIHTLFMAATLAGGVSAAIATAADSDFRTLGNGAMVFRTGRGAVGVLPVTDDIFRITAAPDATGISFPASQSGILEPGAAKVSASVTPELFIVSSPTTTLHIDRATGKVTFYDNEGDLLLSEAGGVDNSGAVKTVKFEGADNEIFYGTGERGHSLALNGDSLTMYNRQNYGYTGSDPRVSQMGISVPYFVSDMGYGVLFDDYNKADLVLGDTIVYSSDTPKPLSYFFINGDRSLAGVTENYTLLTGRQGLPPFWTLGYITSKYGYRTEKEALGVIDSLKTRGYPVDGMVLDLYWYGVETDMGRLEWDKDKWPDHKKMLDDLAEKGVNLVLISQPYINKIGAIDNYNYLSSKGMLVKDSLGNTHDVTTWVGDAGMFDVSNPDTRQWLWNRLRPLTEEGVAGWWGDLGEPEVHPLSIVHANGETASQYHNVYGNEWSRIIYEGLRKDFPDRRPMLMMRGGTAGLQRYSVFPWTTDVSRSWGGLEPQVKLMLSSGLSGLAYMGSDLGGFAVDPAKPYDPELYVRWVSMGAFTPMMRTHAQEKPEPYHYPAQEAIIKKFIKMRYEWLPYNYTLAYENAAFGLPLARPLNFHGDNPDPTFASIGDEYLWGDNVLVAPVIKKGARSRQVHFPEGTWVNWNKPSLRYKGNTTATVAAPLGELPLFVKAGSFIPQYDQPIENVTQYNPQFLTVKYFTSPEETSYTLFDDNRLSPTSLEDKAYQLTTFTGQSSPAETVISFSTDHGSYEGMPQTRMLTFEVIGLSRKPAGASLQDGTVLPESVSPKAIRQYGWNWDNRTRVLTLRLPWNYDTTTLTIRH